MNPKQNPELPDFADLFKPFADAMNEAVEQVRLALRCKMRRFYLVRNVDVDPDKTSGTGIIAEGVVFEDAMIAARWKTPSKSTVIYANVDDLLSIHGHGGKTTL